MQPAPPGSLRRSLHPRARARLLFARAFVFVFVFVLVVVCRSASAGTFRRYDDVVAATERLGILLRRSSLPSSLLLLLDARGSPRA